MNNEDLFIAIGKTDPELLERSEQMRRARRVPVYYRILAAAAAVLLLISGAFTLNMVRIGSSKNGGASFAPKAAEKNDMIVDGDVYDDELSGETAAAVYDDELSGETAAAAIGAPAKEEVPVQEPPAAGAEEIREEPKVETIPAYGNKALRSGQIALIFAGSAAALFLTAGILMIVHKRRNRDTGSDL